MEKWVQLLTATVSLLRLLMDLPDLLIKWRKRWVQRRRRRCVKDEEE
ncbi:hypothetical protein GXN76_00150 [Kroppenstedtia pulmonis]|uniref:Uncharacterized protein n=1 Tax=Kroppenstedtia pulmonis TaxID=1380685 RepID=A0A7D4BN44_9BACL|nr:hypothetical protein [Kroppenstedtia pulmonis]QKG83031.1 hypothetical protein GXN76_00150 [Kroppenstedtia pulmonis]